MDARRFEGLTRRVAEARNRRDAVRLAVTGLAAALVGGTIGREDAAAAEAEGIPIYHCKIPGQICQRDKACCSGKCNNGVCTCNKKGRPCYEPLRGSLCCSARCKNGKCK